MEKKNKRKKRTDYECNVGLAQFLTLVTFIGMFSKTGTFAFAGALMTLIFCYSLKKYRFITFLFLTISMMVIQTITIEEYANVFAGFYFAYAIAYFVISYIFRTKIDL